jgi:TolB-like protein/Tfp pilus assembly protein PilF
LVLVLGAALALATVAYLSRTSRKAAAAPIRLAVLPFQNLSGDPDQEYLSDGMTEEATTELARLNPQRLVVIGRTSVMRFKHSGKGLREIGRELTVDHVLEGSVRRSGERMRVTAQLVRVSDEAHLWAQSYDRPFGDMLTILAEVAQGVGEQVAARLAPAVGPTHRTIRALNPEVYELYLRGRFHFDKLTLEDTGKALALLQEATEKDPTFAPAFAILARAYRGAGGWLMPREDAWPRAKAAAQRALELDETLPDANVTMSMVRLDEYDRAGAMKLVTRALELDPGHSAAREIWGLNLILLGRVEEGVSHWQRAVEHDPLSAKRRQNIEFLYAMLGRLEPARKECRVLEDLHPGTHLSHGCEGYIHERAGEHDAAVARYLAAGELWRESLARTYALAGRRIEARRLLRELEAKWKRDKSASPIQIAAVYAVLCESDAAFRWLETGRSEIDSQIWSVGIAPAFASLRQDPRFRDLKRSIGLPE